METNKVVRNIYYLIKRLTSAIVMFFKELFKPTSYLKGEDFEKCIRKKVFKQSDYELVMKTHDFHENKSDYVESSLYPDYLFRDKKNNKEFFVEAKYREKTFKGKVEWCKEYQFKRYKKLRKGLPVYIAIGLGGRPRNPKQIFVVPLKNIEYSSLYPTFLEEYEIQDKRKNILDNLMDKLYDYEREP